MIKFDILQDYIVGNLDGIEYQYNHLVEDKYSRELDLKAEMHEGYSFILTSMGTSIDSKLENCNIVPVFNSLKDVADLFENEEEFMTTINIIKIHDGKGIKFISCNPGYIGLVKVKDYTLIKSITPADMLTNEDTVTSLIRKLHSKSLNYSVYQDLSNGKLRISGENEIAEIQVKNYKEFCLYTSSSMIERYMRFERQRDNIYYINKINGGSFYLKETSDGTPYIIMIEGFDQYYIKSYGTSKYIKRFEIISKDKNTDIVIAKGIINLHKNNISLEIVKEESNKILIKTGLYVWVYKCIYGSNFRKPLNKLAS